MGDVGAKCASGEAARDDDTSDCGEVAASRSAGAVGGDACVSKGTNAGGGVGESWSKVGSGRLGHGDTGSTLPGALPSRSAPSHDTRTSRPPTSCHLTAVR